MSQLKKLKVVADGDGKENSAFDKRSVRLTGRNALEDLGNNIAIVASSSKKDKSNYFKNDSKSTTTIQPQGYEIQEPTNVTENNDRKRIITRKPKLSFRCQRNLKDDIFLNCFYSTEYCEHNFKLLLKRESSEILSKQILREEIEVTPRMLMIDWIIRLHSSFQLFDISLFMSIKLFDRIIIAMKYDKTKYLLASVVSLWISSKFFDRAIHLPSLSNLSELTKTEILEAERLFLTTLNFELIQVEPETILFYYLKQENLTQYKKIFDGSLFMLHLFLYIPDISAIRPSLLAATALHLTLVKFEIEHDNFLKFVGEYVLKETLFLSWSNKMEKQLVFLMNNKGISHEAVKKFSKVAYSAVALKFQKQIND